MKLISRFFAVAAVALMVGCTTTRPIDMTQERRMVGTENGVRVDAVINTDQLSPAASVPITYEVTNERNVPIAIADLVSDSSYDSDTRTITVTFGSEVPGYDFLPRLLVIPAGEKKSFVGRALVNVPTAGNAVNGAFGHFPSGLRVKLHFLTDLKPFASLIGIQERVVHDPKLADALLPKWLERNETVVTNALPMRWVGPFGGDADSQTGMRRQRP